MQILYIAALAFLLAGCAGTGSGPAEDGADLRSFVLKDLRAAHSLALAGGDDLAVACWAKLIELKAGAPEVEATKVVGALSGYQKIRNVRRAVGKGISDGVKVACAPMLVDSRLVLGRFALIAARRALP